MGEPDIRNGMSSIGEYIAYERATRGIETSQYPEEKKTKSDSVSSGERKRRRPNQQRAGVVGPR